VKHPHTHHGEVLIYKELSHTRLGTLMTQDIPSYSPNDVAQHRYFDNLGGLSQFLVVQHSWLLPVYGIMFSQLLQI